MARPLSLFLLCGDGKSGLVTQNLMYRTVEALSGFNQHSLMSHTQLFSYL